MGAPHQLFHTSPQGRYAVIGGPPDAQNSSERADTEPFGSVSRADHGRPELPPPRRKSPHRPRYDSERACYRPDSLARHHLPQLATRQELAAALDLTVGQLWWLTWPKKEEADEHYVRRTVPKKSGAKRLLCVPKPMTRKAQDWLLNNILRRIPVNDCVHGFVRGRSVVSNARQHIDKRVVINVDLEDFFPSISIASVVGLGEWMGYSATVAWHIAMLCTCPFGDRRALPQGSPTSPTIANLICWRMDRRLQGLAEKFDATYTRYADDMTFSGDRRLDMKLGKFLPFIETICDDEGFRVNHDKTRIMRSGSRQTVTGIVVNDRPNVPREQVRKLRAILHNCKMNGPASQNRANDPQFRERILGKIGQIAMVNPHQGERLMADYQQIDWQES